MYAIYHALFVDPSLQALVPLLLLLGAGGVLSAIARLRRWGVRLLLLAALLLVLYVAWRTGAIAALIDGATSALSRVVEGRS